MLDYRTLQERLTLKFIEYQWRLDTPMPTVYESEAMKVAKYHTNPIFHARVDTLVAGILHIVQNCPEDIRELKPEFKSNQICEEHNCFPCMKCGIKHFKNCSCIFCKEYYE